MKLIQKILFDDETKKQYLVNARLSFVYVYVRKVKKLKFIVILFA